MDRIITCISILVVMTMVSTSVIAKSKRPANPRPADPICAHGSVGPQTTRQEVRSCTKNGKQGTQTCTIITVTCLSGAGEAQSASSEACGPCLTGPNAPAETMSPGNGTGGGGGIGR